MIQRFSSRLTSLTIHLSAIFHILRFMKGAFHFVSVHKALYIILDFWIIVLLLDIHLGDIRSQTGRDYNCITGTSSTTISRNFRLRNGGQQSRFELRVFNHKGFYGEQSFSKTYCTPSKHRFSGTKQSNQCCAIGYIGTNNGRTRGICCSVGFISLETRTTGTQCYVHQPTIESHRRRYFKWEENNKTTRFLNSIMATVVHFHIWKTCQIYAAYQEIDEDCCNIKCSSVYFNGGIAYRQTYLYCRADYVIRFNHQNISTNKVSESNSKLENSADKNTN